jgi:uncharacterized membrane protein required for colicin V production
MNLMLLIVLVVTVYKIVEGYKKGMVKEIISFVSLLIMCVVVVLIGAGLHSYMEKKVLGIVIAIVLLTLVGIAHHLLKVVFFSAKVIAKLPIIHTGDKLLGMVVGVLEIIVILWTIYTFITYFGMGTIGNVILEYTEQSKVLKVIEDYNMLEPLVGDVVNSLKSK